MKKKHSINSPSYVSFCKKILARYMVKILIFHFLQFKKEGHFLISCTFVRLSHRLEEERDFFYIYYSTLYFVELHFDFVLWNIATDRELETFGCFLSGFGTSGLKRRNRWVDVIPVEIPYRALNFFQLKDINKKIK